MHPLVAEAHAHDLVSAPEGLFYRTLRSGSTGYVPAYFRHDLVEQVEIPAAAYHAAKYRGPGGPYQDGESVAFLPSGHSLRCHFHENVVREFTAAGELVRALPPFADPFMDLYAWAVDGDGHLWVADPPLHRVSCYAADGRPLGAVGGSEEMEPGEFDHPKDVVVYEGTHLFVSWGITAWPWWTRAPGPAAPTARLTSRCGSTAAAGAGKWSACAMACSCFSPS